MCYFSQMVPQDIKNLFEADYGTIRSFRPASGGCINNGGRLTTIKNTYFIKWNSATRYPNLFDTESKGLELLRQSELVVPEVIGVIHGEKHDALVLENIETGAAITQTWQNFGAKLARMHQITQATYGLAFDNYMGSLVQQNKQHTHWVDFWINQRLEPQLKLATYKGLCDHQTRRQFEILYHKLGELLITEPPALLHGDLWSGNYMINQNGDAVLIDPAVYYGHREVDLAMTRLFGGFPASFYEAYQKEFPTEKNLNLRLDIYNLYPLLIHLNLFGSGYLMQIKQILQQFN